MEEVRRELIHLRDFRGNGVFLENGSRLYIDCGEHPELATPECTNPREVVSYILAGEHILEGLARGVVSRYDPLSRVMIFKNNVDYSGSESTWGCHESYLYRCDPCLLPEQIIPHLVSRVVLSGAGGFNPLALGLEFSLSPRVYHLRHTVSGGSTWSRGIFHTKDESLSEAGYHRLHILCGESLCSERAMWLKLGTTAIVVAMIEAGLQPAEDIKLQSPLRGIRAFASDPLCRKRVGLRSGRKVTALDLQFHYLELAEVHIDDLFMPLWAAEVCHYWRGTLESLSQDPRGLEREIDWGIKRALYGAWMGKKGFTWESLKNWNHVTKVLKKAFIAAGVKSWPRNRVTMFSAANPIHPDVVKLTPFLRERQMHWDELDKFFDLREEMFELDTRFAQIGSEGIFSMLDRAGELDHNLPALLPVQEAVTQPPSAGRARLRGQLVRRLAGETSRYRCDWNRVWDAKENLIAELSDPFEEEERWREGIIERRKSVFWRLFEGQSLDL